MGYYATITDMGGNDVITACTICPPGSYCPDGIDQFACAAGYFSDSFGQIVCNACSAGTFSAVTGSVACQSCAAGYYNPTTAATECLACLAGTFSAVTGSIACQSCAAGYYNPTTAATECLACVAGTFSAALGSIACTPCAAGYASNAMAATSCSACPPGSYSANLGQVACDLCPANTYNPISAQTSCVACPNGETSGVGAIACTPGCTETVRMDLRTDNLSSQASWQILEQNTNTVLCSFSVPIDGITSPLLEECCLPVGCYRLRVSDSGGDGLVSGGITGGYQLREAAGAQRRIIDNFGNFTDLAGGPPDVSALSNTYDNGAFCVPLGNDKPIFSSCDKTDWVTGKYIVATENTVGILPGGVSGQYGVTSATSGYEFWFFDPNGTYSFRRFRNHATSDGFGTGATRACHFRVNGWTNTITTPHLPANVLLNVRIRGRVAGTNLPFGPACRFKIDAVRAACPLVSLQDNPGNTTDFSCGVGRVFGGANSNANKLVATPPQPIPTVASGSIRYQFRFRVSGEFPQPGSCIVRPPQSSPTLYLNWAAASGQVLECNVTYEVDVRVSRDGGATWCIGNPSAAAANNFQDASDPSTAWGKLCNVTITGGSCLPAFQGVVAAWPCPVVS